MNEFDLSAELQDQLNRQGVAAFRVEDGEVFVLSRETLERLFEAMNDAGRDHVMVFVKQRSDA